jgi:hypothetical protein
MKERFSPLKDLPKNVIQDAMKYASNCSVALVGYSLEKNIVPNAYASGTLISIKDKFGVLTAKHVWDMFHKNNKVKYIHFSILGYPHFIGELVEHINPIFLDIDSDICFLELPTMLISTIKAYRMFYPIKKDNSPQMSEIKDRLWLTFGFPIKMKSDKEKKSIPLRYFTNMTHCCPK